MMSGLDLSKRRAAIESCRNKLTYCIGKEVEVTTTVNKKAVKCVIGKIEFVSRDFFGVRVATEKSNYVQTVSFADVYTEKVICRMK